MHPSREALTIEYALVFGPRRGVRGLGVRRTPGGTGPLGRTPPPASAIWHGQMAVSPERGGVSGSPSLSGKGTGVRSYPARRRAGFARGNRDRGFLWIVGGSAPGIAPAPTPTFQNSRLQGNVELGEPFPRGWDC
jgi:hypothetical protein